MGENSIVSILILLILFIGIPSLLKRLGQYTYTNRNTGRAPDQEKETLPDEHMPEYPEDPLVRNDYQRLSRDPSNKPITPKWF
ncbi:MAG TPA: hypothetical protein VMU10_06420 [Desulfomonilia bacterium]|nr:hypothetical protein [Desulfomonilia bacterium]